MNAAKKMSVTQLIIITAVNMMGSGIVMLPSKLAQVGGLSIVSWLVTAVGSMLLAYAFAQCGMYSKKPGGMNGYAEYPFGKAGNFLCGYSYGISIVIANVAIDTSAVGYGANFFGVTLTPFMTCVYTILVLWVATIPNFGGPQITGKISSVTVWGVILPILLMSTAGWFFFSGDLYLNNWNVHDLPFGTAVGNAITMTLWSFLGLESACANADAVENPEKAVPMAVLCATALCAVVYIASTNVMFGMLPAQEIAESSAPFGLAFAHMFGPVVSRVVMGMMTVACIGCLLGWQFTVPNIFKSMSLEGFMPHFFIETNKWGAPVKGMLVLTGIQSVMALSAISPNLNEQFETLVNLATITNLVCYILCMASVRLIMEAAGKKASLASTTIISTIGFVYALYACYASGFDAMTYGALVVFAGWMFYGYISPRYDLDRNMVSLSSTVNGRAVSSL
jgi:putrescine:ornithine antiporter